MKCRHCGDNITSLNYRCRYTEWGIQYGTCSLGFDDHDFETTNSNDMETDEYEYECPSCEHEIYDEDDIVDDDYEVENDTEEPKEEEMSEENINIKMLKNI